MLWEKRYQNQCPENQWVISLHTPPIYCGPTGHSVCCTHSGTHSPWPGESSRGIPISKSCTSLEVTLITCLTAHWPVQVARPHRTKRGLEMYLGSQTKNTWQTGTDNFPVPSVPLSWPPRENTLYHPSPALCRHFMYLLALVVLLHYYYIYLCFHLHHDTEFLKDRS